MSAPAPASGPAVQQVDGDVLVAVLLGVRATAAALQRQGEAALALVGQVEPQEVASRAEQLLRGVPGAPVFGQPMAGRVEGGAP